MKLIKELLNEGKRLDFKKERGYWDRKTYDKKNKWVLGGGIYSNNWSREDIALAVDEIKKSDEFKKVEEVMPFNSTAKELANGTLSFSSDVGSVLNPTASQQGDTIKVYLGGQIRQQSKGMFKSRSITRVPSPKPKMVAGDPVKSAVQAYKGALEAVRVRYDKIKAMKEKKRDQEVTKKWGDDPMGAWHGRNESKENDVNSNALYEASYTPAERLMASLLKKYNEATQKEHKVYLARGSKPNSKNDWYKIRGSLAKEIDQAAKEFIKHFGYLKDEKGNKITAQNLQYYDLSDIPAFIKAYKNQIRN